MTSKDEAHARQLVWAHLASLPAFRALIRSIEHRLISQRMPLRRPLLDLGVGDGHFGSVVFGRADVGVDVSFSSLCEAAKRQSHAALVCSSAEHLPLRSGSFSTVVANCVVEHVPHLEAVLAESYRVLGANGTLLLTVPTDQLERNLFIPMFLRGAGAPALSRRYVAWFRRAQVHHHLLSRNDWIAAVEYTGLKVVRTRSYMSRRATMWFELLHYAGWHNVVARRLTGRWVIWPWRPRFRLAEALLSRFVDDPERSDDSCLFLEACKTEPRSWAGT